MRDLFNGFTPFLAMAASSPTGTQTGSEIDLFGYEGALLAIAVGVVTDGSHVFTLTESDTSGSGYGAVAAGDVLGTLPTLVTGGSGGGSDVHLVTYKGAKRYIKVVKTVSGSPSTGCRVTVAALLGKPRHLPADV